MKFSSPREFIDWPHKAVTIFGMSGVGKSTLAGLLRTSGWFHYSVDYRIGTRYMNEHIVDNFKREAMRVPFLRDLLMTDSIYIASNLTFENLEPLSTYLGKPGTPDKGGLAFDEYRRRQTLHRAAEISAMDDIGHFLDKAREIYSYSHFICDSSGSLCEVIDLDDPDDPVIAAMTRHTLPVYIRASDGHTRTLIERFACQPKPMYYRPGFLAETWQQFKQENAITSDDAVDPDRFAVWGFEKLIHDRLPRYEELARQHGIAVEMSDIAGVHSAQDFITLIAQTIGNS